MAASNQINAGEIALRVKKAHSAMEDAGFSSVLVSSPKNVEYLTGRDTGRVLLSSGGDILWTREIYKSIYCDLYSGKRYPYEVRIHGKDAVKNEIHKRRLRKVAVENLPVTYFNGLKKDIKVRLTPCDIVEKLRAVKTPVEVGLLRKSASIAVKGMRKAYEVIDSGVKEIDALALIEYEIRRLGSDSPPFNDGMLLSSGRASADIHARAGSKRIGENTVVVADLGARFRGYYSDMTRTIPVGRAGKEALCLLEFVDGLRAEAIDSLEVGIKAGDVHSHIDGQIEKRGYKFFHSSGHGVGLNVHEMPSLGPGSQDVLSENAVFTIEPGVYLSGRFGVRFEDTVLLTRRGPKMLTRMRYEG